LQKSYQWTKIGENFQEVSISKDGVLYAIGNQGGYGGNPIYIYQNGVWTQIPGEAVRLAAYQNGEIWVVNT
jgi:hypothetical protein